MKRKHTDKMTTSELIRAGHTELSRMLRKRFFDSIQKHHGPRPASFRKHIGHRRSLSLYIKPEQLEK